MRRDLAFVSLPAHAALDISAARSQVVACMLGRASSHGNAPVIERRTHTGPTVAAESSMCAAQVGQDYDCRLGASRFSQLVSSTTVGSVMSESGQSPPVIARLAGYRVRNDPKADLIPMPQPPTGGTCFSSSVTEEHDHAGSSDRYLRAR